jgi:hypothetical protein
LAHSAQHLPAGGDAGAASQQVDAPAEAAAPADMVRYSFCMRYQDVMSTSRCQQHMLCQAMTISPRVCLLLITEKGLQISA